MASEGPGLRVARDAKCIGTTTAHNRRRPGRKARQGLRRNSLPQEMLEKTMSTINTSIPHHNPSSSSAAATYFVFLAHATPSTLEAWAHTHVLRTEHAHAATSQRSLKQSAPGAAAHSVDTAPRLRKGQPPRTQSLYAFSLAPPSLTAKDGGGVGLHGPYAGARDGTAGFSAARGCATMGRPAFTCGL